MKIFRNKSLLLSILILSSFGFVLAQEKNYAQFVNPFIGTGGHGHTYPGVSLPFGMVQLSPDTRVDGSWDGCSGYHYSDSLIYGFSHTHLSGTGCSDYGDIMLMPTYGKPVYERNEYRSKFSHAQEIAAAGYYSVKLKQAKVELSATTRVGIHKYSFTSSDSANVLFDMTHRDRVSDCVIKVISNTKVEGYRQSEAWAKKQTVYFVIEFSEPFIDATLCSDKKCSIINRKITEKDAKVNFRFTLPKGKSLMVKVAISNVSEEGANKNLVAELNHWNFDKVVADAKHAWNKELGKIDIPTTDKEKSTIFYTALYHTMLQPNVNMDVDRQYRGMDGKVHEAKDFTYYTVFSLWDTFRATHPLYTIIDQKRSLDFIKTFLAQYSEGGRLPVWELSCNETDCMIGYHSVSVIADALAKNINQFNRELAFEAMVKSATWSHNGLPMFNVKGYIAVDDESESVSRTLEYAYDDWCIAQVAKSLGKEKDYELYMQRAQHYKNMFDPQRGFMRARRNGSWLEPFEPREVNGHYTEANAWQYTFFVPQDINGLIGMMGGKDAFERKLDELFVANSKTTGNDQADITGLIGQYAHGNEPSHHMAYLYNYIGKPHKTQERVNYILEEFYKNRPDGLIGNEDCGQMSAWYVLSSMGFYQVTPGNPMYTITSPLFDQVNIKLENGKTFSITAAGASSGKRFIEKVQVGQEQRYFFSHDELLAGAKLNFTMNTSRVIGTMPVSAFPVSEIKAKDLLLSPHISAKSRAFRDKLEITMFGANQQEKIYYTANGKDPDNLSAVYVNPIVCDSSCLVKAVKINAAGEMSPVSSARFYKFPNDWSVQLTGAYSALYSAGGPEGLIDGIRGSDNWRKGDWQGYQGQDFEAVIDMKKESPIKTVSVGFLQDSRSWILMPTELEVFVSNDSKEFKSIGIVKNSIDPKENNVLLKDFEVKVTESVSAKYIKVKARNYGALPPWHQGYGGEAFIFTDEIIIR